MLAFKFELIEWTANDVQPFNRILFAVFRSRLAYFVITFVFLATRRRHGELSYANFVRTNNPNTRKKEKNRGEKERQNTSTKINSTPIFTTYTSTENIC